jgi:hypothetical protein
MIRWGNMEVQGDPFDCRMAGRGVQEMRCMIEYPLNEEG